MRFRQQLLSVFYEGEGYLGLIRRLTGLWLLLTIPLGLFNLFYPPYHVPSWRIGDVFLAAPEPPIFVSAVVWLIYLICCMLMVIGMKQRFLPIYLLAVWLYYHTVENFCFTTMPVILLSCYLAALAIEHKPRSLSRLVIRVAVSSVYFYAAVHKIHPEFFQGYTLHTSLGDAVFVRDEFAGFVKSLQMPFALTLVMSWLVILSELFIGFGLWFKSCRIYAVICGILLHILFTLTIQCIDVFSLVIWTGYLAFYENRLVPNFYEGKHYRQRLSDIIVAATVCAACILIPLRIYFGGWDDFVGMSLYDRSPWGLGIFLFNEEIEGLQVKYQLSDKSWHTFQPVQRMLYPHWSRADLIAACRYVSKEHPEAQAVSIKLKAVINRRRSIAKSFIFMVPEDKFTYSQIEEKSMGTNSK
jgi:hypothetical protein